MTMYSLTRRLPLGILTTNAIVAADYILIPTDADSDAISGIAQSATRFSRQGSIATWTRKSSASCSPSSTAPE